MRVTVAGTVAGLDAIVKRVQEATRQVTADAAHIIQAQSMQEAPVGVYGNSTNAPGDLRRSIDVQGPEGSGGRYMARVGPTVVYGRQRELGGDIYPKRGTYLAFHWGREPGTTGLPHLSDGRVLVRHVYQPPNPYMLRGEMESLAMIEAITKERMAAAVVGT